MKYDFMCKATGIILNSIVKKEIHDKAVVKSIKNGYREIIERAADIGSGNKLEGSYILGSYFISMNRNDSLSPDENCRILEDGLQNSKVFKMMMGNADHYFDEKNMEDRRKWSALTHERKYKNDWVVDILEKTDDYEFGLDYTECGLCKLCNDENCPELAKYMCSLDFMISELIGVKLTRTMTIAEGYDKCDFRFSKK